AVGGIAWSQSTPQPMEIVNDEPIVLPATPWFGSGSTLFIEAPDGAATVGPPQSYGCVGTAGTTTKDLRGQPDRKRLGTRVVDGVSLAPAVAIGPTTSGQVLQCADVPDQTRAFVLQTDPGIPIMPLSVVLAGVGCAGLAVLAHPRGRTAGVFGR
ncbi:MAG: hypothetical protein ACK5MP_06350, partial [Nostocoides sp.]